MSEVVSDNGEEVNIITDDRRMVDGERKTPAFAQTDLEVIAQAGKRVRAISSLELADELERSGNLTAEQAEAMREMMSRPRELGEYTPGPEYLREGREYDVREWRVTQGCTWRRVAELAYEAWGGNWHPPSNQLVGMAICKWAAQKYGQDYMGGPWN